MATLALFPFIDALVSTFQGASTLSDVTVYDGPFITRDAYNKILYIGHDGSPPDYSGKLIGKARSDYKPLGARHEDELGSIECVLVVNSGESNAQGTLRATIEDVFTRLKAVLRTDASFGQTVQWSWISDLSLEYDGNNKGTGIRLLFTISYKART